MAAASTAKLLGRFIQDRAASEDYRKHLGIVALVRRDFEKLSRLIEEDNWQLSPSGPADTRFGGLGKYSSLEEEAKGAATRINRIVLYIDDLDRCPPATVVSVLQAVHLLLAFPLFVVVVGVDARWIARSLETRYRELLHVGNADSADDIAGLFGVARSEDYLEKIFQIPLWLKKMDAGGARRMVNGLLRRNANVSSTGNGAADQARETLVVDRESFLPSEAASRHAVRTDVPEREQESGTRNLSAAATPDGSPSAVDAPSAPVSAAPNLESLEIRDFELAAIDVLSPLLGRSPRALKRFVNVYRLIKAGLSPQQHRTFVRQGDKTISDFQAALFLLAIDTGLPRISAAVFEVIMTAGQGGERLTDAESFLTQLETRAVESTADRERLEAWIRQRATAFESRDFRKLAAWVPHVSRYSFQAAPVDSSWEARESRNAQRESARQLPSGSELS